MIYRVCLGIVATEKMVYGFFFMLRRNVYLTRERRKISAYKSGSVAYAGVELWIRDGLIEVLELLN